MSEQVGIEGVKGLVQAANALSLDVIKALKLKSGAVAEGIALIESLLADEAFKASVSAVISKFGELPAEIKDLSAQEVVELASIEIAMVPQVIAALKG